MLQFGIRQSSWMLNKNDREAQQKKINVLIKGKKWRWSSDDVMCWDYLGLKQFCKNNDVRSSWEFYCNFENLHNHWNSLVDFLTMTQECRGFSRQRFSFCLFLRIFYNMTSTPNVSIPPTLLYMLIITRRHRDWLERRRKIRKSKNHFSVCLPCQKELIATCRSSSQRCLPKTLPLTSSQREKWD